MGLLLYTVPVSAVTIYQYQVYVLKPAKVVDVLFLIAKKTALIAPFFLMVAFYFMEQDIHQMGVMVLYCH